MRMRNNKGTEDTMNEVEPHETDQCTDCDDVRQSISPGHTGRIGICYQILLSLIFFGSQLSIEFYGIYGILTLQYFGLPTYLLSMNGLISGLICLVVVPTLGAFSDGGPRPKFRKTVMQGIALCILLVGYTLVVTSAAVVTEHYAKGTQSYTLTNESNSWNISMTSEQNFTLMNKTTRLYNFNQTLVADDFSTHPTTSEESGINVAGVLGLIAFSCFDVSFDMIVSLSKGLIVESVSPRQKIQVLNTSTFLVGLGSCFMSLIGMLDLPHYLGSVFDIDGMAATLILLCSCFIVVSIITYVTSIHTALKLYRRNKTTRKDRNDEILILNGKTMNTDDSKTTNSFSDKIVFDNQMNEYSTLDKQVDSNDDQSASNSLVLYNGLEQSTEKELQNEIHHSDIQFDTIDGNDKPKCWNYPRNRYFTLAMFSAFLSFGSLLTGSLYSSRTLTIEVYGGDPTATPGTPARDRYEEGIKMSSLGFLISGIVYLVTSFSNTKLLKIIDQNLLFAFSSILLTVTSILFYLLKNVWAYMVMIATFGFFRCISHIVVYVNALKYALYDKKIPSAGEIPEETTAPTGKVTSLAGATVPLHYLLLSFMGPAMDAYGSSWLPILYLGGISCLNAVIIMLMKVI